MTTEERKALAASLTHIERIAYRAAHAAGLADAQLTATTGMSPCDLPGYDEFAVIDAALTEATKDRPKVPDLGPWVPKEGSLYNAIESTGGTTIDSAVHGDQSFQDRVSAGNVFPYGRPGLDAAKREARYTRAHRRLRQIAAVLNAGKEIQFGDKVWRIYRTNGFIEPLYYTHSSGTGQTFTGETRFASKEDAQAALAQLKSEGIDVADLFDGGA